MRTEYTIMYTHAGHALRAIDTPFATKNLAEKALRNFKKIRPWWTDKEMKTLFIKETEIDKEPRKEMREYNGKSVYNLDYLNWDALEPGDYVEEEIGDDILDALPPACMRADCLQLGEPHSSRIDENGNDRSTYLTVKRTADHSVLEFCGYCFRGENVERGTEPVYI